MRGFISKLFGDDVLDNVTDRISAISDVISKFSQYDRLDIKDSDKVVKDYLEGINESEIKALVTNISVPFERLNRYAVYDELYGMTHLIKRIVKIYIDNILQKDLVSGEILLIKPSQKYQLSDSEFTSAKNLVDTMIKGFSLRNLLIDIIVPNLLKYGDVFLEVIDLEKEKVVYPRRETDIVESDISYFNANLRRLMSYAEGNSVNGSIDLLRERVEDDLFNILFEIDVPDDDYEEEITEAKNNKNASPQIRSIDEVVIDTKRVLVRSHKPHDIIILATSTGEILGYVHVMDVMTRKDMTLSPSYRLATIISQVSGSIKDSKTEIENISDRFVKKIVANIISKLKIDNPNITAEEFAEIVEKNLSKELLYTVKSFLVSLRDSNRINKKIKVRFIPKHRMVHFRRPSAEYYPYGESIIDSMVLPGKLYLLHLITSIVMKLTRAVPIRKWIVETGPRNIHSALLNNLKRELRNKRITMDDLVSFKSIPKIMSDFDDVVIFSKKGQRFLDFEIVNAEDSSSKLSDLEDARRELISVSGVPAAYLGFPDIVELRDQLVSINICFATEISAYQEIVCNGLNNLLDIISSVYGINPPITAYAKIHLTPPIILMLQLLETTVGSITNISTQLQTLKGVVLDPVTLLKQYVPYIDWDQVIDKGRELMVKTQTEEVQ